MPKYRVEVHQVNIFRDIDAENTERAREIAAEDYIWDESEKNNILFI